MEVRDRVYRSDVAQPLGRFGSLSGALAERTGGGAGVPLHPSSESIRPITWYIRAGKCKCTTALLNYIVLHRDACVLSAERKVGLNNISAIVAVFLRVSYNIQ